MELSAYISDGTKAGAKNAHSGPLQWVMRAVIQDHTMQVWVDHHHWKRQKKRQKKRQRNRHEQQSYRGCRTIFAR
jgi:hypothetical protein